MVTEYMLELRACHIKIVDHLQYSGASIMIEKQKQSTQYNACMQLYHFAPSYWISYDSITFWGHQHSQIIFSKISANADKSYEQWIRLSAVHSMDTLYRGMT